MTELINAFGYRMAFVALIAPTFLFAIFGFIVGNIAAMFHARKPGENYEVAGRRQKKIVRAFVFGFSLSGFLLNIIAYKNEFAELFRAFF